MRNSHKQRKPSRHYDVETDKGRIAVSANNRAHAARMTKGAGFQVHSVTFTG